MTTMMRILLLAALAGLPLAGAAQEADTTQTTGHVEIGGWGADESGQLEQAAEYEPTDGGPFLDLLVSSHMPGGSLLVDVNGHDGDDLEADLAFDVGRMVRSHTSYDKLLHRFLHDPLENLAAATNHGRVVEHSDLNPGMEYDLSYSLLQHRTELQLPNLSAITFAVDLRQEHREGNKQLVMTSHCDTCHAVARNRPLNEHTKDATFSARAAWAGGSLVGSVTGREHTQNVPYLLHTFDNALHPEQQTPVFDARLQYDSAAGPIPVDLMPDIDKDRAKLMLTLNNVAGFVVQGGGVWSETENRYTGLKADYAGYLVNAARRFDDVTVRWRGRVYAIDNDDVYVDTAEPAHIAGPRVGLTYREIWGDEPNFPELDYWRYSALDRDGLESRLDVSTKLGRRSTLTGTWDFETVDRDHYQVAVGETETTTNVVGLAFRTRPAKGWRLNAQARHAEVDNPFMLIDGACSTNEASAVPNPFHPDGEQYFDFHAARVADTTASPSSWDELRLAASYTAGTTAVSGLYRFWDGSNSDGDLTDWSRTQQTAVVSLLSQPAEHWQWYAAYAWADGDLDAPACIPVFDG